MSIEYRKYELISREENFEIRFYPAALLATTEINSGKYSDAANTGFRKLAGYIFGGNKEGKKIAMTSPVEMKMGKEKTEMSFTMPKQYNITELPQPNDQNIFLQKTTEEYTASVSFGGYASDKKIARYTEELKKILASKKINTIGNFRYLGYNSPFKIFGRRNEILVAISYIKN